MGLAKYHQKRDFSKTPEPRGKIARKAAKKLSFVIQKHAASRLHYDFRLELDGVLKSWAVPKGPSFRTTEKRLAVEVEDHPLEYGTFEGTIPQGEYGGGTVLLWDRGTWTPIGDPHEGLRQGKLKFTLDGEKLQGGWTLVRMGGRAAQEGKPNWLLIKERDDLARTDGADITDERPESVSTGRDLEAIASGVGGRRVWSSQRAFEGEPSLRSQSKPARKSARKATATSSKKKSARKAARKTSAKARSQSPRLARIAVDAAAVEGARRAPMLRDVEAELATLVAGAPAGDQWLHEIKYDGYRMLVGVQNGGVRWTTRRGKDWSARMGPLSSAVLELSVRNAIFDGEVVVLRADGTTSFQDLQNAFGEAPADLSVFLFDLLYLDGFDLRGAALEERKRVLASLCAALPAGSPVRYSDHVVGSGEGFHAQACRHALEGIVSKRRDQPYRGGRQLDWQKTKCQSRQEFVVGGWTDPQGARAGLGALLVGVFDAQKELRYAGKVGTGFDHDTLLELVRRLKKIERAKPAFVDPPRGYDARGVHWTAPTLVAEVEFTGWTSDGHLRHPTFQGLRADKRPVDVVRERPVDVVRKRPGDAVRERPGAAPTKARRSVRAMRASARASRSAAPETAKRGETRPIRRTSSAGASRTEEFAGVRLTHPDRVLYPEQGITKLDLARHYELVLDRMLPYVADRPVSIVRCPEGRAKSCFFQRHAGESLPPSIRTVDVDDGRGKKPYLVVDSLAGLVGLVQIGALELHPWGARTDKIEAPDVVIFDLDPDPGAPYALVVEYAGTIRARLEELGLESFLKTTGGKGLHVVVPLQRKQSWETAKSFAERLAKSLEREDPERVIATASKAARKGKVFIDWLRNARGASAIAPYSTRARENAPVSVPLEWDELDVRLKPDAFNVTNLGLRLKKSRKDPWKGYAAVKQSLTASIVRSVGK